jgi:nicotinamide mononucleotide transporter PnuC
MNKLNKFEWGLIIIISILNILTFIVYDDVNIIGIISSITGVICVVLTAKGHISCYGWGIINIATYATIAWQTRFYGEVIENLVYYLPMQFVGIYLWKKNINKETNIVKARAMKLKEIIITTVIAILGIVGFSYVLTLLNSYQPLADSATNILAVVAMYLSVKMFKEQWILWIIVDIISVYMWIVALIQGEANSAVMVLMWGAYLINAFYGWINWNKLEKR